MSKNIVSESLVVEDWRDLRLTLDQMQRKSERERERGETSECTTTVGLALRMLVRFKDLPSASSSPPFSSIFP